MDAFITALTAAVTPTLLWAQLAPVAAFIASIVIFSFGYYVLRKVIRGAAHGKATA